MHAVLDRFSSVFGDKRGLPKGLCESRRTEDLWADGSLLNVLTDGKFSPGESILIAGEDDVLGATFNQIVAGLIEHGESCMI
jgi:hypothetical protein